MYSREYFRKLIIENLLPKVGIEKALELYTDTPIEIVDIYNKKCCDNILTEKEILNKLIEIVIKEYDTDSSTEVNSKVIEKLEYIKSQYTDTTIMNPELAEAIKYLVDTYLGENNSEKFLNLYSFPKPKKRCILCKLFCKEEV